MLRKSALPRSLARCIHRGTFFSSADASKLHTRSHLLDVYHHTCVPHACSSCAAMCTRNTSMTLDACVLPFSYTGVATQTYVPRLLSPRHLLRQGLATNQHERSRGAPAPITTTEERATKTEVSSPLKISTHSRVFRMLIPVFPGTVSSSSAEPM